MTDLRKGLDACAVDNEQYEQANNELTAEIERLRHEIDVQCSSEYVERILKENERLRAALEQIANPCDGEGYGEVLRDIAREALRDD